MDAVRQIRDYTALARRYFDLISCSGTDWRPEYEQEMQELRVELSELKPQIESFARK